MSGEVDFANAPTLEAQLQAAEMLPADELLIDLSAVEFMDVAALRVLLRARDRATAARPVHVVATSPPVQRLINLLGPTRTGTLRIEYSG